MSKRKGSYNEHNAMRILEAAGYHTTRAAGSFGKRKEATPTSGAACFPLMFDGQHRANILLPGEVFVSTKRVTIGRPD